MVDGAQRTSRLYTTAWVRRYVASWRARYGQSRITLVVDAQWLDRIGEAQPTFAVPRQRDGRSQRARPPTFRVAVEPYAPHELAWLGRG